MSESQIIKPVAASVKISSMDAHRMLTHPQQPPSRKGTQPPRRIAGPIQPEVNGVKMKDAPIDFVMQTGGVMVKRPPAPTPARQVAPIALSPRNDVDRLVESELTKQSSRFEAAYDAMLAEKDAEIAEKDAAIVALRTELDDLKTAFGAAAGVGG